MLRAVLVAPPGAGKGTQGERLGAAYGVPHISAGDILRTHVARHTPAGLLVAAVLDGGELVQDAIVTRAVLDQLAEAAKGFVLDGFPRTLAQAVALDEWTVHVGRPLQAAIELEVPREELVNRLTRRGAHSSRSDDTQATILHRLNVYDREAHELLTYYRERGILIAVDGTGEIDVVTERIRIQLDHRLAELSPNQDAESDTPDRAFEQ